MLLNDFMRDSFGEKDLVYANPKKIVDLELSPGTKDFVLMVGFPYLLRCFRFSMEFDRLADDIFIRDSVENSEKLFTFGCKSASQLIGRMIHLSEIGLERESSLLTISKRLKKLGAENAILESEVQLSHRICVDSVSDQILVVDPTDCSISFLNSNIQKLAASICCYHKNFSNKSSDEFDDCMMNFKDEIQRIDENSLRSKDNWWSIIVDQLILEEEELR
jgi:hypothetical protein